MVNRTPEMTAGTRLGGKVVRNIVVVPERIRFGGDVVVDIMRVIAS
jgi:hypothetical protein